jgi:hypothetical protein
MMKSRFSVWTGAKINSLMSKLGISKAKSVSTAGSVDEAKEKIKQNQQGTEIALSKQRLDSLSTSIDKLTNAIERFRESSQSRGTPG